MLSHVKLHIATVESFLIIFKVFSCSPLLHCPGNLWHFTDLNQRVILTGLCSSHHPISVFPPPPSCMAGVQATCPASVCCYSQNPALASSKNNLLLSTWLPLPLLSSNPCLSLALTPTLSCIYPGSLLETLQMPHHLTSSSATMEPRALPLRPIVWCENETMVAVVI